MEWGVGIVECGVWSPKSKVWSVWSVWSVKCGVGIVECKVRSGLRKV